jgi:hypothetical protein
MTETIGAYQREYGRKVEKSLANVKRALKTEELPVLGKDEYVQ